MLREYCTKSPSKLLKILKASLFQPNASSFRFTCIEEGATSRCRDIMRHVIQCALLLLSFNSRDSYILQNTPRDTQRASTVSSIDFICRIMFKSGSAISGFSPVSPSGNDQFSKPVNSCSHWVQSLLKARYDLVQPSREDLTNLSAGAIVIERHSAAQTVYEVIMEPFSRAMQRRVIARIQNVTRADRRG